MVVRRARGAAAARGAVRRARDAGGEVEEVFRCVRRRRGARARARQRAAGVPGEQQQRRL